MSIVLIVLFACAAALLLWAGVLELKIRLMSRKSKYENVARQFRKTGIAKKWIAELHTVPVSEWAKIYCQLNSRQYPIELINIKPDFYDIDDEKSVAFFIIISDEIENIIGEYETSQYWNCFHRTDPRKMTVSEHAQWWANNKKR